MAVAPQSLLGAGCRFGAPAARRAINGFCKALPGLLPGGTKPIGCSLASDPPELELGDGSPRPLPPPSPAPAFACPDPLFVLAAAGASRSPEEPCHSLYEPIEV